MQFELNDCPHLRSSLPVGIDADGAIIWKCGDCPETWTDSVTPVEALEQGWVTQVELDSLLAMS